MTALAIISNPMAFIRRRFQQWFENRLPFSDHVTLTQRTVYILPTGPGLMLGITLLTLLVASINYQLNLGYLLTFLLAGSALVGMHICHATLRGLAMNIVAPHAQYAGASATIDIKLTNSRRSVRYGIGLSVLKPIATRTKEVKPAHGGWVCVPGACLKSAPCSAARLSTAFLLCCSPAAPLSWARARSK